MAHTYIVSLYIRTQMCACKPTHTHKHALLQLSIESSTHWLFFKLKIKHVRLKVLIFLPENAKKQNLLCTAAAYTP